MHRHRLSPHALLIDASHRAQPSHVHRPGLSQAPRSISDGHHRLPRSRYRLPHSAPHRCLRYPLCGFACAWFHSELNRCACDSHTSAKDRDCPVRSCSFIRTRDRTQLQLVSRPCLRQTSNLVRNCCQSLSCSMRNVSHATCQ